MDLYTSLTRLKMAMNGGELPPMTPLPESALVAIDPAFTIGGNGLGGLVEDEAKGLRCPVRGCGRWYHQITHHLDRSHAEEGGAARVRELLEIPASASLISTRLREKFVANNERRDSAAALATWRTLHPGETARMARASRAVRVAGVRHTSRTVGFKNLLDSCPQQLAHKLIDLHKKLGRSPCADEGRAEYGPGFVSAVQRVYGSWNNAKAQVGLERWKTSKQRWSQAAVLEALNAWYEVHGSLPSSLAIRRRRSTPVMPSKSAILSRFNTSSWPEAMRRAAALLNIYGGKFGLPERKAVA